ncbi:ATP-dependent DNA helicase Q1-like [Sabethes cyaneus]|uniref:ATP-dependent DNA helicase Q1-like n=1 Tax=Sabethes cyaneus TaxID=53552 RepID=UPI00237E735F|nr:ATP-dependent DNA helicase Q1-like [Sabethes cyaneus]
MKMCDLDIELSEADNDTRIVAVERELEEIDLKISQLRARRKQLEQLQERLHIHKVQENSNLLVEKKWDAENFHWSDRVRTVLKDVFHMEKFRAQQLAAINAVLSQNDVILLAPTGGGKSLCYQLPALVAEGITIVVSPLISLMEDQAWALKKIGVKAEYICATSDKELVNSVHKMLREGNDSAIRLLYITPERIAKSNRFMLALQKCYNIKKLALIAIDEVHCCSQWGHNYRPDYKNLCVLKTMFPDVPLLGVTATATTKVIADVKKMLNLRECLILNAPFNRPNLYYHVLEKPADKEELHDFLASLIRKKYRNMSGIIYTYSIKDTEELSVQLLQREVKVLPYHASLAAKDRTKTHKKWMQNEIQVIVATNAFGMGIDKPDVRFVIHHTLCKSMESFYQESGRAGRDGKRSDCILLYRFQDIFRLSTVIFSEYEGLENVYSMIKYCINGKDCRRKLISRFFAEVWEDTDCDRMCDRCYYRDKVQLPEQDINPHYNTLLAILRRAETLKTKLTALKLVDAWYHKGSPKNRLEQPPPLMDRYIGEQVVAFLIVNGYLKEDFQYNQYSAISYITKGTASVGKSGIRFQAARVLRIPVESSTDTSTSRTSLPGDSFETASVTSSTNRAEKSSKTSLAKRKVLSENEDNDEYESFSSRGLSSVSSSNSTLISNDCRTDKRRRKADSSNCLQISELVALKRDEMRNSARELNKSYEDEDVLFVPIEDEVIEIDE